MKKGLKNFISGIVGLIFLGALASCGNSTKYLDGGVCGNATTEGTAFYEIRQVFCEQYVYDLNKTLVSDGYDYYAIADAYDDKFVVENNALVKVEAGTDAYTSAHYLFTFYNDANKQMVENYVATTAYDNTKYLALLDIQANGASGKETQGYFTKADPANVSLDADSENNITSVQNRLSSHSKACMVFDEPIVDPSTGVSMKVTTWKDAWDVGLLYGLFVYPIGWLINFFAKVAGGSGWAQILSIFIVTFILKIAIFLLTFRSQSSTQKMQDMQPELLKLQAKYGQNPSQEDRQRMSMEMMALYKKYGVKPLAPFASLLITFPVFIAMYRAVNFLAVLRTGSIGGVTLGYNLNTYIIGGTFSWVALLIFALMAASQILSMKFPSFLNRKRMTKEAKEQQKQANTMTNVMMIMILVMGFFMPVVMSIYWIASAIVGVAQQLIMHYVNNSSKKKGQFKLKKVDSDPITIPQGYKK